MMVLMEGGDGEGEEEEENTWLEEEKVLSIDKHTFIGGFRT